ncbi:MAG: FTR1 family protein [Candidatus Rokubacteria bacterium]|nr:FTR1 family protein [Candidatus Rokubacteria bacterium]
MSATFLVALREAFEAALLLGIVYGYLDKIGRGYHARWVTAGAAAGVLASIAAGAAMTWLSGPLLDLGPDVVGAAVIFLAVGVLTWMTAWMRQHARAVMGQVQRRVDAAERSHRLWVIALIAFTGVFREGAETVLFMWGMVSQPGDGGTAWSNLGGAVLGIAAAAALAWAIFRGGRRLSLPRFFTVTSALLLFVAAGLFATGVGRLAAMGILPVTSALWDTSWLVDDGCIVGSFLGGLVGYRARPTSLEVAAWGSYVVVAGLLFFGDLLRRPRRRSATVRGPVAPAEPWSRPDA